MLLVLNHELGADFDPSLFEHRAFYEPTAHRIEMHLVAVRDHDVMIPGIGIVAFRAGESIRTEISGKYDRQSVTDLFAAAGLGLEAWREDPDGLFAVALGAPV
jgi:L-histidine N-alpha-methyltransferase